MSSFFKVLGTEIATTIARPSRVLNVFSARHRAIWAGFNRTQLATPDTWAKVDGGTTGRRYDDYAQYLAHQKSILGLIDLTAYDAAFRPALKERIERNGLALRGDSVLCLAARVGTEVKAFRDLGCFAVGTDINNRPGDPCVLYGDFQNIEFPDASTDIVYTNSMDHVFDVHRVLSEVERVMRAGGTFIVEIAHGAKHGIPPGPYEAFWWESIDDLAALVERHGFKPVRTEAFEIPYPGEMRVFRRGE